MFQRSYYAGLPAKLGNPNRASDAIIDLEDELCARWTNAYRNGGGAGGDIRTVTMNAEDGSDAFVSTMFDIRPGRSKTGPDDRVVAVWGISRSEPASTRDTGRIAGLLKGQWSAQYPGRDRGHFWAHTMGGGMDINLFPQVISVNRGGRWRQLETYAADHPGTFCFIHPIYGNDSWIPTELEYGLYAIPPLPFKFLDGDSFKN